MRKIKLSIMKQMILINYSIVSVTKCKLIYRSPIPNPMIL